MLRMGRFAVAFDGFVYTDCYQTSPEKRDVAQRSPVEQIMLRFVPSEDEMSQRHYEWIR